MTNDKTKDVVLAALKQGMAESGEQRLFRSGKLPGLFAGRTSLNGEAAAQAVPDRLREALQRADAAVPKVPEAAANSVAWAQETAGYLDRRREGGVLNSCPLPELFAALREKNPDLTIKDFHEGLRRLHDRGVL